MYLKINNESAYCNNTTKTIATQLRDHENNGNKANKQKDAIVTPTTLDPTNALDVIKSIAQRERGGCNTILKDIVLYSIHAGAVNGKNNKRIILDNVQILL